MNSDLRFRILEMIVKSGEGHIPSSFSIVDIIEFIYGECLKVDLNSKEKINNDLFLLSKGHGAAALYVVLEKYGILTKEQINSYGNSESILGGHPDSTKVPGAEASTGSLGHGLPIGVGIALGNKIQDGSGRVFCLLGDGECQEGSVWEAANIAANQQLFNLIVFVDWNGSGQQLMPIENLASRWNSFGWNVIEADGHARLSLTNAMKNLDESKRPNVIIAKTIKGKGSKLLSGHGIWHHKIPDEQQVQEIRKELEDE
jgi:transketolase